MAIGPSTFGAVAGAASDLFAGLGARSQSSLKAKGLGLEAKGLRIKAQGDLAEASNYDLATELARKNEQFTVASTAIKQAQLDRSITQTIGGQRAEVAGSGLKASGSALQLMRDSAEQGSLTKQVAGSQGLITEAGYEEQAQSYTTLANAGRMAAAGEMDIANETDQLAQDTRSAGKTQMFGSFISAGIKAAAAVASVALAPETGGLSLLALPALADDSGGGGDG